MDAEEHDQRALKSALEHIDRNKGKYDTIDAQERMLAKLIEDRGLKMKYDSQRNMAIILRPHRDRGGFKTKYDRQIVAIVLPLDKKAFRQRLAALPFKKGKGKDKSVEDLFHEGSAAIDNDFLKEIQYSTQTRDGDSKSRQGSATKDEEYEKIGRENPGDNVSKAKEKKSRKAKEDIFQERGGPSKETREEAISRESDSDSDNGAKPKTEGHQQEILQGKVDLLPKIRSNPRLILKVTSGIGKKRRVESASDIESGGVALPSGKGVQPKRGNVDSNDVDEAGMQPATRTGRSAGAASASKPRDCTEEKVNRKEIRMELDEIGQLVRDLTAAMFEATEADENACARVVPNPSKDLETLYKLLWGEKWASCVCPVTSGGGRAYHVVEACMAAAVYQTAKKQLPFDLKENVLAENQLRVPYIDDVLRAYDVRLSMDMLADQIVRNMVVDAAYQDKILKPLAKEWASNIMLVLYEQLKGVNAILPPAKGALNNILDEYQHELEAIICKFQTLRGQLRVSGATYRFFWPNSNRPFTEAEMMEVRPNEGIRRVAWCILPGVGIITSDDQRVCVCKSRVFTRK